MIIWPQKRHNDVRYTVSEWVCEVVIQHITVTSIILFKVYNFLRQMRFQYEYFPGIFNDLSQTQNCVPCLDHNLWKETVVILAPKTEFWTFSEFIVTACSVLARSKSGLRLPCPPHLLLPLHLRAPGPAPDTCLWFVNPLIPSLSLFAPPPSPTLAFKLWRRSLWRWSASTSRTAETATSRRAWKGRNSIYYVQYVLYCAE